MPDPDRQWLHINAGLPCNDGSKANPRRDPSKLLEHVATFFFVVRRLQERFAKVTWFAENVVCEPFVAAMKALFPNSVHEVTDSGWFTAEQRKRAYFASPEFDLTKLTELDEGCTVEEWFKLDAKNGPYEMQSWSSGTKEPTTWHSKERAHRRGVARANEGDGGPARSSGTPTLSDARCSRPPSGRFACCEWCGVP